MAAVPPPCHRSRHQKGNHPADVGIEVRKPHQQLHDARVDDEADQAADREQHELVTSLMRENSSHTFDAGMLDHATLRDDGIDQIAGVTSKHGIPRFRAFDHGAAPATLSNSAASRSSMSMSSPDAVAISTVDDGATTMNFTP